MSVSDALRAYAAGRIPAQELVGVVVVAYYGNRGAGSGAWLRPVMDVIERAHPGVVELSSSDQKPGFAVRLAERPFPKQWEPALRAAASGTISGAEPSPSPVPAPGFFTRILRAIRKIFSA